MSTKTNVSNGHIIDPSCDKSGIIVNDNNIVYSCTLNQTDITNNKNKFYIMQLIKNGNDYIQYIRYGRIGEPGKKRYNNFTSQTSAITAFKKQFKAKTKNEWNTNDFVKKSGKYFMTETSYEDELKDVDDYSDEEKLESELNERVQNLIQLISDINMMKNTMIELDIDTKKMPLGKLKSNQLDKASKILEDIRAEIQKLKTATDKKVIITSLEKLSSTYYTYIPYACGRRKPPIISNDELLTKFADTVDDLKNIVINVKISKQVVKGIHPLDNVFSELNTNITPVKKNTKIWNTLFKYFTNTHAPTHNFKLKLVDILEVSRNNNYSAYNKVAKKIGNRQLLIHGSRVCNWVSILKNNLLMDPSRLGVYISGKMFGYGVYFANSFSKSAQYCGTPYGKSSRICLALAEVAMGNESERLNSDYYITKQSLESTGHHSTWGRGEMTPNKYEQIGNVKVPVGSLSKSKAKSVLRYDEKIVYDINQFCIKFLVIADMSYT